MSFYDQAILKLTFKIAVNQEAIPKKRFRVILEDVNE